MAQRLVNIRENQYFGVVLVLLAGTLWSTVGIAVRLIEEASVWQILFYRSVSLSIFLLIVINFFHKANVLRLVKENILTYLYGGIALFFAYSGGIYSIQHTSVANAMLLFGSAPIITAILASFFIKERISISTALSIGAAFIGILIMVIQESAGNSLKGNLAALGSALAFSLFTINLRYKKNIEMLPCIFMSGLVGITLTSIIVYYDGSGVNLPQSDVTIAICMGVFQVGSGLVLYTIGSKSVPATQLTILAMGEVLLGPVWVWIFLGEVVSLNTFIGGSILLCAITYNALYVKESHKQ